MPMPPTVRVQPLDDVDRHRDQLCVLGVHAPVAVCIDGHVDGITQLMAAVARCAADQAVVLRGPEAGVNVEWHILPARRTGPRRDLSEHQLHLVEQSRIHGCVSRPRVTAAGQKV
jgi:hypothetical protein